VHEEKEVYARVLIARDAWTARHWAKRSGETQLPKTVTFPIAVVLMLWCAVLLGDASAGSLERVEFEGASQTLLRGGVMPGDRIQGYLARPDGAGPFPAVVGLHGCAGMHEAAKQKLANELVAAGYVTLLVDSFATRGIDHLCTYSAVNISRRMADAYGALAFLARQAFVDIRRVAAVGFSQGASIALLLTETRSVHPFVVPSDLRFRAAVAFYPPCGPGGLRPVIPTLIRGAEGAPIELVVYPGTHHGFYYPHLQPGRMLFDHWLEYNGDAADNANVRMRQFLDRHLN
jgi:dienelactone hydrolase